ncbi:hypothetical protein LIA77_03878 [Sarocladium implicatum]|nr:hypothetical protein LIA77_03878 [Sarocladium implicatum]
MSLLPMSGMLLRGVPYLSQCSSKPEAMVPQWRSESLPQHDSPKAAVVAANSPSVPHRLHGFPKRTRGDGEMSLCRTRPVSRSGGLLILNTFDLRTRPRQADDSRR